MNFYLKDVLTQPQELRNAFAYYRENGPWERIAAWKPEKVVFCGMGSSHFCAVAPSLYMRQRGMDSEVISAGQLLHYEEAIWENNPLLVLISQSGESAEIVRILEQLPERVSVLAITNEPDSMLGRRGDITLDIHVSQEKSVTTRTYLGSAALAQLTAAALCGEEVEPFLTKMEELTWDMEAYLTSYEAQMETLGAFTKDMRYLCLLGRGFALETVQAGALFMREVLRFPALDFDCGEFRHGPMEMVQSDFYGIVFAPSGATQKLNLKMASDIADKQGRVIVITDEAAKTRELENRSNVLLIRLPVTEEWASVFPEILPVQLLANALAEDRKLPVGEFRWGSKIMRVE